MHIYIPTVQVAGSSTERELGENQTEVYIYLQVAGNSVEGELREDQGYLKITRVGLEEI